MKLLSGLTCATYTPMTESGELNLSVVEAYTDYIIESGLNALYVCGSTGEGVSLSVEERQQTAEAFTTAARGRIPVVIQVGSNSIEDSRALAAHARKIGVSAVSANAPSYFKIASEQTLVDYMAVIADAAGQLPFYYYHIPSFTGVTLNMPKFLELAQGRISNLAGIKYSDIKTFEFMECVNFAGGKYEILWGSDEMLLAALACGAHGGIGSTYAQIPVVYKNIIDAWKAGDLQNARKWQLKSWEYVKILLKTGNLHGAQKFILDQIGFSVGPCRLPIAKLSEQTRQVLLQDWELFKQTLQ